MSVSVCFIERREGGSPSIERVFRGVSGELERNGIATSFVKAPYGNGIVGTLLNLLFFRPPKSDLYHITGHINYMGLVLARASTILTVHDLTILDFRSGVRKWLITKLFFVWPARRLKHVTVISDATRSKLAEVAGIPAEMIRVIENPLLVTKSRGRPFNERRPTILQVGTAPNKNVERLAQAIAGMDCRLHIVGPLSNSLRARLSELKVDMVNDDYLDDLGIEKAYDEADIVTLCSTDEGFGLPIIEAQAKRTIVITSDRSPMREVAGHGAVLVDPDDPISIRTAIAKIVHDQEFRERLIERGEANLHRFDVSVIAKEYLDLYRNILETQ